jgi:hypothetical protein
MPDYLIFTCVSIPTVKSIKKNKTAQSGETGNLEISGWSDVSTRDLLFL